MRILLVGGGSGGHVFPLIAVYRKITEIAREKDIKDVEFLFMGPDNFSCDVFRKEGVKSHMVLSGKMRRYLSILNFLDIFKMPVGFVQAYLYILLFMPDVILARGGYGSVLPSVIGWVFRIPIVIHESDAVPGLANRILAHLAKIIIVSFDETASLFPAKKTAVIGNPIRRGLFENLPSNPREVLKVHSQRPLVLILGGSQGAEQINNLILLILPELIKRYEIIHQCGEGKTENMKKGSFMEISDTETRKLYHIYELLTEEELSGGYYLADLIISRAGSGAIFEIAASGKPSIMIPYNGGAGDHQQVNADSYAKTGAAVVLDKDNLMPHVLLNAIDSIISDPERSMKMKEAALKFSKLDAAEKIARAILALAQD